MSAPRPTKPHTQDILTLVTEYFRTADQLVATASAPEDHVALQDLRKQELILRSRLKNCA